LRKCCCLRSSLCTGSFLIGNRVLHYAPGRSFCRHVRSFDQLVNQNLLQARQYTRPAAKVTSFEVASFAVLSISAPKRKSRLVKLSDFGSRFRSARTDKLANIHEASGDTHRPPELRGRFIGQCYLSLRRLLRSVKVGS
jgi:hypothetical protein